MARSCAAEDDRPADAFDESGSLLLPPGTLGGLSVDEGDLVSLTITARGIQLTRIDEDELHPHPDAVRQRWAEIVSGRQTDRAGDGGAEHLRRCRRSVPRPHPPITELFDDVGVARNGDWVASAGFDFAGYWATVRASKIAEGYQLGRDEAIAVAALSSLHGRLTDLVDAVLGIRDLDDEDSHATWHPSSSGPSPGARRPASGPDAPWDRWSRFVAHPEVASALLEETISLGESGAEALGLMVESLEEEASSATRPALRWLRAKAHESLGRVSDAEADLHAAERFDPSWPLTLLDLARYASDRGDAPRGLALLARAAP